MTDKARRILETQARDHLRRTGYFQSPIPAQVYTFCPRRPCQARLEVSLPAGKRGASAAERALTPALADHWEDGHGVV